MGFYTTQDWKHTKILHLQI